MIIITDINIDIDTKSTVLVTIIKMVIKNLWCHRHFVQQKTMDTRNTIKAMMTSILIWIDDSTNYREIEEELLHLDIVINASHLSHETKLKWDTAYKSQDISPIANIIGCILKSL